MSQLNKLTSKQRLVFEIVTWYSSPPQMMDFFKENPFQHLIAEIVALEQGYFVQALANE